MDFGVDEPQVVIYDAIATVPCTDVGKAGQVKPVVGRVGLAEPGWSLLERRWFNICYLVPTGGGLPDRS